MKTLGGNVMGTLLWKIFLTFSQHLCETFPYKHQGIITKHLKPDDAILKFHWYFLKSTQLWDMLGNIAQKSYISLAILSLCKGHIEG